MPAKKLSTVHVSIIVVHSAFLTQWISPYNSMGFVLVFPKQWSFLAWQTFPGEFPSYLSKGSRWDFPLHFLFCGPSYIVQGFPCLTCKCWLSALPNTLPVLHHMPHVGEVYQLMTRARQMIAVTTFRKSNKNSLENQAGTHQVGKETSIQGTPALVTTNEKRLLFFTKFLTSVS